MTFTSPAYMRMVKPRQGAQDYELNSASITGNLTIAGVVTPASVAGLSSLIGKASRVADPLVLGMKDDALGARRLHDADAPAELIKAGRDERDNGDRHAKPAQLIRHIRPLVSLFIVLSVALNRV